jgi:hypothetical protein
MNIIHTQVQSNYAPSVLSLSGRDEIRRALSWHRPRTKPSLSLLFYPENVIDGDENIYEMTWC